MPTAREVVTAATRVYLATSVPPRIVRSRARKVTARAMPPTCRARGGPCRRVRTRAQVTERLVATSTVWNACDSSVAIATTARAPRRPDATARRPARRALADPARLTLLGPRLREAALSCGFSPTSRSAKGATASTSSAATTTRRPSFPTRTTSAKASSRVGSSQTSSTTPFVRSTSTWKPWQRASQYARTVDVRPNQRGSAASSLVMDPPVTLRMTASNGCRARGRPRVAGVPRSGTT